MVVNFSIKKEKDKEPNRIRNKRGREVVFHQKGSAFVLKPPCVFYLIFRNCWERATPGSADGIAFFPPDREKGAA